jgi:hypothetical protein
MRRLLEVQFLALWLSAGCGLPEAPRSPAPTPAAPAAPAAPVMAVGLAAPYVPEDLAKVALVARPGAEAAPSYVAEPPRNIDGQAAARGRAYLNELRRRAPELERLEPAERERRRGELKRQLLGF